MLFFLITTGRCPEAPNWDPAFAAVAGLAQADAPSPPTGAAPPHTTTTAAPARVTGLWGATRLALHLPAATLARGLALAVPAAAPWFFHVGERVAPAFGGALVVLLFFDGCVLLGLPRRRALGAAGILAIGSGVWFYARQPDLLIWSAVATTWALVCALRLWTVGRGQSSPQGPVNVGRPTWRWLVWFGPVVFAGPLYALALPGLLAAVIWKTRAPSTGISKGARHPVLLRLGQTTFATVFSVAVLVGLQAVVDALVNALLSQDGSSLGPSWTSLWALPRTEPAVLAYWGQLFSPGKGAFVFCPLFFLSLLAVPKTIGRAPHLVGLTGLVTVPIWLCLWKWPGWMLGDGWGPETGLFALAPLCGPPPLVWTTSPGMTNGTRPPASAWSRPFAWSALGPRCPASSSNPKLTETLSINWGINGWVTIDLSLPALGVRMAPSKAGTHTCGCHHFNPFLVTPGP